MDAPKTKNIPSVKCGYLSHCQNSMKNCFAVFTEIGQSAAELWPENEHNSDVIACNNGAIHYAN